MFRQTHLEAMLRHTPNLKQLKLAAMVGANEYRYNWARLFAALKEHNIILNKALFSNCVTGMSAEETELLMTDVYPQSSTELSIWAMDITPRLFQTVLLRSDTLTTLEIWWKPSALSHNRFAEASDQSLTEAYALIHHYLCETLYFAHLTSLKTVLRIQDMDLFDRGQYINKSLRELMMRRETPSELSTPSPSGRPSIWRCRGLRILHIDIHTPNLDEMEDPFYSRIIFGYISRVCPQLEDLQICVPNQYCYDANGLLHYQAPSLQLSAGFCLLGRLSNLQRLRVVSMRVYVFLKCKDWELNWMIDSGRKSAVSRKKRRLAVKSWREMRANENQLEAIRLSHLQLKKETATLVDEAEPDSRSGVVQGGDTNILHRLRNLGLLVDVEEMIKEMDNIEFRPLPSLEWLSLDCPILLRPEEELKRQFAHKKL
ncbi:hypothetical protein BGW39_009479 [Mortierella sp. 14UC]|nr:hypothetical protein BGW39_009479 [Mortierella sp. 14UC]